MTQEAWRLLWFLCPFSSKRPSKHCALCTVHCLSLLNVECEKSMTGFLCHVCKVYKWHCCIAEVAGHFPWKNCYSDFLFVKPWRQEEQMSLTSMRGYLTADLKINLWLYALQLMLDLCQQQELQAVLCLTCAERRKMYWRNCKLLQEKNGWTLLSYFDSQSWELLRISRWQSHILVVPLNKFLEEILPQ